ncbi:hypothetical protein P3X46_009173 [Hevea brasiliensis]|uniref:non-specific serine/threonine protein kinase n=1 Tax=Hevea brasiliensis TaxID=3981 RepID=A0ABQ9MPH8_HEVBR|nr:probable serine/threonine-protein kinase BSK3 isoform X2 [Hevea brasiliensis]KAJ9180996.1 hypothetical protein P3X46_009173 [Hevea brasiliensis]
MSDFATLIASLLGCCNRKCAAYTRERNSTELRRYNFVELADATQSFSNNNLLGVGGFGTVYKGCLDDKVVAIKKLRFVKDEEPEEEPQEIKYLKRVSHRNLVNLIGYCSDGANKLLVLEFVPNKTLRHHLDGKGNVLEWATRMKIAVKSAYGLQYLHENCKIIHRDVKSENILLDNNFEPKLADFSLAVFLPNIDNVGHITSVLRRKNVYADPEYAKRKVSKKSDVYSFGVVLLELITGRKPLSESDSIVTWAKSRIEEVLYDKKYEGFVDLKLRGACDEREMQRMTYCAAACVYKPLNSRPNMKQIIEILEATTPLKERISLHGGSRFDLQSVLGIESKQITSPRIFTYEELARATAHFSNKNLLGEGGFGIVFKGSLVTGEIVAIKKLKHVGEEQSKSSEFEKVIMDMSHIRHRNLVKLIGYCIEEFNRLVVYEFVPNKSLGFHLHGNIRMTMDWSTRMRIAMGVAKGLTYLHEWCQPKIIHGNIKVANILLDYSFEPKISDFGLSKMNVDLSNSYISRVNSEGSSGYLAPEYINDRKLTDKCDVFSFGIVLLELITGKKAIKNEGGFHNRLSTLAVPLIKRALDKGDYNVIIDEKLQSYNKDKMVRMIHCAASCVYKPADYRPQMSHIVQVLEGNVPVESIWLRNDSTFLFHGAPYVPHNY